MQKSVLEKTAKQKSSAFSHIFKLYLAIWIVLSIALISLLIKNDFEKALLEFEQFNKEITDHVTERMLVAETALEGFSAYVSQSSSINHSELSLFVSNLLKRYPFLYMFEVAEKVSHDQREEIESGFRNIFPGFYIRRFDYEKTRQWQPVEKSEFYYPIIFQEPFYNDNRNILGLDLFASDFLVEAMFESQVQSLPVATRPFILAENELGYVIHRAAGSVTANQPQPLTAKRYALLALKSEDLFSNIKTTSAAISISLRHGGFQLQNGNNPIVLEKISTKGGKVDQVLFPEMTFTKDLSQITPSQPFILHTRFQLGLDSFSYILVSFILMAAILIPMLGKKFAYQYFEKRLNDMESDGSLFYLANYDALTGIPNRYRLLEHLEMMIIRARRNNTKFKIFFIDLDNLKPINDFHGHAAGDFVLNELCSRIADRMRHDEMLARFGGDEFVLVSNHYSDEQDEAELIYRIKQQFTSPILYRNEEFIVDISVGCATYPEDGKNLNALLETADERMYLDKKKNKKLSPVT